MRQSVKIFSAALDELPGGTIVIRGIVDPASLDMLQIPSYQREILPISRISDLVNALKTGRVPDVELGLRGGGYTEREGNFYLSDDLFIIDGLQRITAGRQLLREGGDKKPHIGALIHVNTDEAWERARFRILNMERIRLSPNILLRNMQQDNNAIATLYSLSLDDDGCVMKGRVCWAQRMSREHLLTALTFIKTAGILHARFGPARSHKLEEISDGIEKIMKAVGRNNLRANVRTFWDAMDQCWGIRSVMYREGAAHLRGTFLWCFAEILGSHEDFWRENKLFVGRDLLAKIKLFPITDGYVKDLASASGQARKILLRLMIEHINSGKRSKRLRPFPKNYELDEVDEGSSESNGQEGQPVE